MPKSAAAAGPTRWAIKQDFLDQAKKNMAIDQEIRREDLVTGCADGYQAFKVLYDKFNLKGDLEVLHITEYSTRLIKDGKLKPAEESQPHRHLS